MRVDISDVSWLWPPDHPGDLKKLITDDVLARCGKAFFNTPYKGKWCMLRAALEEFVRVVEESSRER